MSDIDQIKSDIDAGTPGPLQQLWDDYLEAATATGSNENGSIDLYDIDEMNEAACAIFYHAEIVTAERDAQAAQIASLEAERDRMKAALNAMYAATNGTSKEPDDVANACNCLACQLARAAIGGEHE